MTSLTIPYRFRGPATSGNGGWTSGALAEVLGGTASPAPAVRVRLSAPPPLERPLTLERDGDRLTATDGDRLIATGTLVDEAEASAMPPVRPAPLDQAEQASERYTGLVDHPFPECFACGTRREDGLGLRPGPAPGEDGLVLAGWRPDGSVVDADGLVLLPVVWAALDCPGGWSVDIAGRPMVLGTMTACVIERPRPGEQLVVAGTVDELSDRKALTRTTLYRRDMQVLAIATHVWVAVDPTAFGAGS